MKEVSTITALICYGVAIVWAIISWYSFTALVAGWVTMFGVALCLFIFGN